jgi:hypothetical protein
MARRRQGTNPFYLLLVIAGVAFSVTAFAYGVMALKAISPTIGEETHPLLTFLDHHGMMLMAIELGSLAVTCFLAMGTDRYWSRPSADDEIARTSGKE